VHCGLPSSCQSILMRWPWRRQLGRWVPVGGQHHGHESCRWPRRYWQRSPTSGPPVKWRRRRIVGVVKGQVRHERSGRRGEETLSRGLLMCGGESCFMIKPRNSQGISVLGGLAQKGSLRAHRQHWPQSRDQEP
jgi:hypothetical protein